MFQVSRIGIATLVAAVGLLLGGVALSTANQRASAAASEQEAAKADSGVPVLAVGFSKADGTLIRSSGAKLSVSKSARQKGLYTVTFAKELKSAPVILVTPDVSVEGYPLLYRVQSTKNGFEVEFWFPPQNGQVNTGTSWDSAFHFAVFQADDRTP